MTNLCRRCPSAHNHLGPRTDVLGLEGGEGFRLVVLAGTGQPTEPQDPSTELDWRDAVVALATAVVERAGTIVVPANVELVSLLGLAAYPHAQAHPAERLHPTAPVEAVETGGESFASRTLLSPYAHRNVVSYLDRSMSVVPLAEMPAPSGEDGELLREVRHHPFRAELLEGAVGVVVIHPDRRMAEELFDLREREPRRLAVFGNAEGLPLELSEWARYHDPVGDLLGHLVELDAVADAMPYPLIMELLLDSWLDRNN